MIADKMRKFFQDHVVVMIKVFVTTCVVPRTMLEALSMFAWNGLGLGFADAQWVLFRRKS